MAVSCNLVVLRVADLDRSAEFYRAIGLTFSQERHGSGPEHLAAESAGLVFELYPQKDGSTSSGTRIGFTVPDVDASVRRIKSVGGTIAVEPKPSELGVRAVAIDPDGHRVELTQQLK